MRTTARLARYALAVSFLLASIAARARAGDWTDADCTRWIGTPQHAACVAAYRELTQSDCGKWTPGEREFAKCVHAQNLARVQGCQAAGMSARDGNGRRIAKHVSCPLANEQTGELNGARPMPPRSAIVKGEPPRAINMEAARRAARVARTATAVRRSGELQGPPEPQARVTDVQRTGPLSWSNIRPAP